MKKFLLLALVMFSMNSFAQTSKINVNEFKGLEKTLKFETSKPVKLTKASSANKVKAQAAPEGTTKLYYADYGESVYQLGVLQRAHEKYGIVFGADGTVNIPNMFARNNVGENIYLKGTYNESTNEITIDNNQEIYNEDGASLVVCNINPETGEAMTSSNFKLTLDPETGLISSAEDTFLGAFLNYGGNTTLYTYCTSLYYYPAELFPEAVSHNYTYKDYYGDNMSTTVDIVNLGELFYIKNLMPEHPNAWMVGYFDGNNLVVPSYMVGDDDVALLFATTDEIVESCTFTYNSSTDSYTSESGVELLDYFYYDGDSQNQAGFYLSNSCSNMVIAGKTTGINKVENGSENVVSTNYYDLSGRRINNASKGISIKVMKYADGTSKAVKVMK